MVNDGLPTDDEYINDDGLLKGFDEKRTAVFQGHVAQIFCLKARAVAFGTPVLLFKRAP